MAFCNGPQDHGSTTERHMFVPSKTDKLLALVFRFMKGISAIVVVGCMLALIGGVAGFLLSLPKQVRIPRFADLRESFSAKERPKKPVSFEELQVSQEDTRTRIEGEYGKAIDQIVREYDFSLNERQRLIEDVTLMDADYRQSYLSGLVAFLSEAHNYINKRGDEARTSTLEALYAYRRAFREAILTSKASQATSAATRIACLSVIGGCIVALMLFIFLPLLIMVEQNTRLLLRSSAESDL